jgi:hypothetical protein
MKSVGHFCDVRWTHQRFNCQRHENVLYLPVTANAATVTVIKRLHM